MAFSANKSGLNSKKSIFDRQKEEAEAKKARDEAETAAVYEDFVKSFDDEGNSATSSRPSHALSNTGHAAGSGKRHFTNSGLKSGPGSLGPTPGLSRGGPGGFGPSSGFGKKRQFDEYSGRKERDRLHNDRDGRRVAEVLDQEERERKEEEDRAAARPTLHLSSLPPGTSPAVVKAILQPSPLAVESVKILPGPMTDRKSTSAIVTLAAETSATDIDTMVSQLQNRYMGFGFNLSISRHLSSAALSGAGALNALGTKADSLPFGARPIPQQVSLSRAPPPGRGRGFAPPASYTSSTPYGAQPQTQVVVQPPSDLKQLKLIHKTVEALLTYGPKFEALLMSRPQIQKDDKWAWLWNARSQGGVYYRWRLWKVLTNSDGRAQPQRMGMKPIGDLLFEGQSQWIAPEENIKFEYVTNVDEFVSDDDYNSSDEEEDEDASGLARRHNDHNVGGTISEPGQDINDGLGYLNPLSKTKLVHLLSRLPETNAKLRKGDVARVTAFAIEHAGAGANEVASLVTRNVVKPFAHQSKQEHEEQSDTERPSFNTDKTDTSSASLVALYTISDILSSSASAGVRHAWRYRSLFESALRQQKVFETLGRMDRDLNWGKLKAEKWKRSVQNLLGLWEGWCVFPQSTYEELVNSFINPPLSEKERLLVEQDEKRKGEAEKKAKATSRWRTVEEKTKGDVEMSGVDGSPMADDEHVDEMVMGENEDVDGVSMLDSSDEEMAEAEGKEETGHQAAEEQHPPPPREKSPPRPSVKVDPSSAKRNRPTAKDMFGSDSD